MAARTIDDQVEALLGRSVAEPKVRGIPDPTVESSAVFDSIVLNLLLKPRSALYFTFLARNGLQQAVTAELALLDTLTQDVTDTGNRSFKLEGAPVLQRAHTALIQLEELPRLSKGAQPLQLYRDAIDEYLQKYLAKNVRQKKGELTRPAVEARVDMVSTIQELKDQHADLLDRLYKLAVGVENFLQVPFGAMLGTATVTRSRVDLEEIINHVSNDGSSGPSRDFAVRLIAARETVGTLSSPPGPFDPLLPEGTVVESIRESSSFTSAPGPFVLGTNPTATVTVDGVTATGAFLVGTPFLVSAPLSFPLTVPDEYGLFVSVDGVQHRILLAATHASLASLVSAINTAAVGNLRAQAFSDRLLLYTTQGTDTELRISTIYQYTYDETIGEGVTVTSQKVSAKSAHELLGFFPGQSGTVEVPASTVALALNLLSPELSVKALGNGRLLFSFDTDFRAATFSFPSSLGVPASFYAQSSAVTFPGKDARELVQVGDSLDFSGTKRIVTEVTQGIVSLDLPLRLYIGRATGTSALVTDYDAFSEKLRFFLKRWRETPYAKTLDQLDRALAPLSTSATPGQRNFAKAEIDRLRTELTTLSAILSDASNTLPDGAAQEEKQVVAGILQTLMERKYDRAADFLMRGDLASLLEMDSDSASYGGHFLKSASSFAQTNFTSDTLESEKDSAISAGHT